MLQLSCNTQEGVQAVKNAACERLLADRVAHKLQAGTTSAGTVGGRLAEVMGRIHVAMPLGGATRETFIPDAVKNLRKFDKTDPERRILARDVEFENGGAGVFNVDLKADYKLKDPAWRYDKIPEFLDGKNVYDFIDPDIEAKLQALEEEEEKLEKEGYYDSESEMEDDEEEEILHKANLIREKQALIRNEAKMRKSLKNRAMIPRKQLKKTISQLDDHLDELGVDTTEIVRRAREQSTTRGRSLNRSRAGTEDADAMDVDTPKTAQDRIRERSRARSQSMVNRREDGVQEVTARSKAERQAKLGQRKMNRMARQGEADRHVGTAMPKHLVSFLQAGRRIAFPPHKHPASPSWIRLFANLPDNLVCWQERHGQDISALDSGTCFLLVPSVLLFRSFFIWSCHGVVSLILFMGWAGRKEMSRMLAAVMINAGF